MADAPDPGGAKDGAKDDAAPAAATPPDQGSAMELELSQALIELRRLTLFRGPAFGEAIPRYFTEEQLRELMARLEDAQLFMPLQGPRARRDGPGSLGVPAPVGCWNRECYGPPPGRTSPRRRWPL